MTPTRPVLALELSSDGISLHEQAYDGHWRRLAFAALNDPLLGRKMKDMRQKARDSKGRTFRCQVWIPAEQISLQEIQLEGDEPTGFPEQVRAILGPDTGEIDIGVTDSKGRAWVAHVPSEVLAQARKFARDYGFPASAVSTSAPLKGFSRPPFFDHVANATVMPSVDWPRIAFLGGVVATAALLAFGGKWVWDQIDFSSDPSEAISVPVETNISTEADPRAPIRPTELGQDATRPAPVRYTRDEGYSLPTAPEAVTDRNFLSLGYQTPAGLDGAIDAEFGTPLTTTADDEINTTAATPFSVARPDSLPAPESTGLMIEVDNLPSPVLPDATSAVESAQPMPVYSTAATPLGINRTGFGSDAEINSLSVTANPVRQSIIDDGYGLTRVQALNLAAELEARSLREQTLPPVILSGRPDPLPRLRGGNAVPDGPPPPPVDVTALQRLAPVILNGLPSPFPRVRGGTDILEAVASNTALPDVPVEPTPKPVDEVAQIIALQNAPARIIGVVPEEIIPPLRGGIDIPEATPTEAEAETPPEQDSPEVETLQNAPVAAAEGTPDGDPVDEVAALVAAAQQDSAAARQAEAARLLPLRRPEKIAAVAAIANLSEGAVADVSRAPVQRPSSIAARADELRKKAEAARRTVPVFNDAPRNVSVPTSANVAREATIKDGIDLNDMSLITIAGAPGNLRAIIRLRGGNYERVKVGQTVNGWKVVAITESGVRLQKGSKTETLKLPAVK